MQGLFHKDSKLMKLMTWFADMAHIQLLWIVFTLVGLVFGGFFPATVSMFALIRKRIQSGDGFSFNKEFWAHYKKNLVKANLLGYSILAMSLLLGLHYQYSLNVQGSLSFLFTLSSLGLWLIFLLVVLYIVPTYVHFDIKNVQVIKHAFIMVISTPLHAVGMAGLCYLFYLSARVVPVLVPFVSVGVLAYGIMRLANHAFKSVDDVAEKEGQRKNKKETSYSELSTENKS
ncbi:hypothetical protein GCM10008932_17590 [Alkalibacterium iburiense]|uniref:DUF624 domain-containing protein n=1 Tax=Alkalibacterium iburiense TaxID=290589 RepID=A0ABP3HBN3_9LACT